VWKLIEMCLDVTVGKVKRKKVSNVNKEKKKRVRDNRHGDVDVNNANKRFI
jgi:hypothetical protein